MTLEKIREILREHTVYAERWDCDLCGYHEDANCEAVGCTWKGTTSGFNDHLDWLITEAWNS